MVDDTSAIASVVITSPQTSIKVGETVQLTAEAKNVNGNTVSSTIDSWTSSATSILSIDANGLASGQSFGSSEVRATSGNVTSNAFVIQVQPATTNSRSGTFRGHGSYRVSGDVTIQQKTGGGLELVFTNFSTSNGPGLYIYMSNTTTGGNRNRKTDTNIR